MELTSARAQYDITPTARGLQSRKSDQDRETTVLACAEHRCRCALLASRDRCLHARHRIALVHEAHTDARAYAGIRAQTNASSRGHHHQHKAGGIVRKGAPRAASPSDEHNSRHRRKRADRKPRAGPRQVAVRVCRAPRHHPRPRLHRVSRAILHGCAAPARTGKP